MKKPSRYVALFLAVQLAACSGEETSPLAAPAEWAGAARSEQPEAAVAADERLVLAFGDSLYAGYGLEQTQSFPAVLERELEGLGIPARVVNAGVSGDTTSAGLRRLQFTLEGLERKPDLVLLGLGANDALRGLDPAETRRNLDTMLKSLESEGIPVMMTGMLAPRNLDSAYVRQFDSIYPDLAQRHGADLDPFFLDGVITRSDLLLADGMHPNAEGIRLIARRLAPRVAKHLDTAAPKAGAEIAVRGEQP